MQEAPGRHLLVRAPSLQTESLVHRIQSLQQRRRRGSWSRNHESVNSPTTEEAMVWAEAARKRWWTKAWFEPRTSQKDFENRSDRPEKIPAVFR
jgi:hypothetical protein